MIHRECPELVRAVFADWQSLLISGLMLLACLFLVDPVHAEKTAESTPRGDVQDETDAQDARQKGATNSADEGASSDEEGATGSGSNSRGALIPRAAIVDMTRAQSRVICTSEVFLSCMDFDSNECLGLSESAIEQCLMPLPASFDPTELDSETLEACPKALYEQAGYPEEKAAQCFEGAIAADSRE